MKENPAGEMRKFRIEGLDCARCALRIETALRRIEGFDEAQVNFGTRTIRIPADARGRAEQVIARIEPDVRLTDCSAGSAGSAAQSKTVVKGLNNAMRLPRMGLAAALTVGGMVFEERMHAAASPILEYAVFLNAYLLVGAPVVFKALRGILRGRMLDELFLMSAATMGAFAIHELPEAVSVMFFYAVGEYVQDLAVGRSRLSIASLMDLRPDSARLIDEHGRSTDTAPETVEIGSVVEVRPGERVPLDGEVTAGTSLVDTSALTGESVPRSVKPGDAVLAGFVNDSTTIRIRISKPFAESSLSRIFDLVEDAAARKAPTEKFISRFASVYTPIVVGIAILAAFLPPLLLPGIAPADSVYRALVVLVVSCPCALVISVPLGYFGGIGGASRRGILIKGANYVDALKDVSTVVMDKTGTLTKGVFKVIDKVAAEGLEPQDVLRLAVTAELHSTHPIAGSIREAYRAEAGEQGKGGNLPGIDAVEDVREEKGLGVIVQAGGRQITVGSDRLMRREGIAFTPHHASGSGTVVYAAAEGVCAGYLVIADEIKDEAAAAVKDLRSAGVERVLMFTGDNVNAARRVADELGLDGWYAELLPEDKVAKVEELTAGLPRGKRLAFVGDGINDAPVLMRSDVGFAMGALGSDAAIEAADVVLMDDRVDGIASAIRIARHTRSVVLQNIGFALIIKLVFVALGTAGLAAMWEAVIADMGVSVLAVLNAFRTQRGSGIGGLKAPVKKSRGNR